MKKKKNAMDNAQSAAAVMAMTVASNTTVPPSEADLPAAEATTTV